MSLFYQLTQMWCNTFLTIIPLVLGSQIATAAFFFFGGQGGGLVRWGGWGGIFQEINILFQNKILGNIKTFGKNRITFVGVSYWKLHPSAASVLISKSRVRSG